MKNECRKLIVMPYFHVNSFWPNLSDIKKCFHEFFTDGTQTGLPMNRSSGVLLGPDSREK